MIDNEALKVKAKLQTIFKKKYELFKAPRKCCVETVTRSQFCPRPSVRAARPAPGRRTGRSSLLFAAVSSSFLELVLVTQLMVRD